VHVLGGHLVVVSPKTPGQRPFKTSRIELQGTEADQSSFLLDAEAQQEWERINSRAARSLPGLTRLLERPSPFAQPAADQPQP
jgi:hypothetical protein